MERGAGLEYFSGPPNYWNRETINSNILRKLRDSDVEGSKWDPSSIMHYPFEPGLITSPKPYDETGLGENVGFSPGDKEWARRFYPARTSAVPIAPLQLERLDALAGQQRDYLFQPAATREYTIRVVGEADCKVVVFEERNGVPRHFAAADDSGLEANASIAAKFVKGRRYIIRVRVHYITSADGIGLLLH